MARHALLIGVSEFADQRLARLNAPANDVIALRGILLDGSRGHFDSVELSLNDDFVAMRDHLSRFFHDRVPDDLLLLYYSGHGILGRGNRLFLATTGSSLDTPRDRSISAKEIRDFIEDCRAERQIVVLDCCHSGAFAEHAKSAAPPPAVTEETFSGSDAGLYVLTAADALQFAWDGAELRAGNDAAGGFSQFTSWLVEGLEKGEAAPDDEQITIDALYRYLFRRARSAGAPSTPQRFVQGGVGDLVISHNPAAGLSQVDPATRAALAGEDWRARLGAVAELAQQLREGVSIAARPARMLLQDQLQRERDYAVRTAITTALHEAAPAAVSTAQRDGSSATSAGPASPEAHLTGKTADTPRAEGEAGFQPFGKTTVAGLTRRPARIALIAVGICAVGAIATYEFVAPSVTSTELIQSPGSSVGADPTGSTDPSPSVNANNVGDNTGTYIGTYTATYAPGANTVVARFQQSGTKLTEMYETSTGVSGSGSGTVSGNVGTMSWQNTTPTCPGDFHGTVRFSEDAVTFTGAGRDCLGAEQITGQAKKMANEPGAGGSSVDLLPGGPTKLLR